MASKLPVPRVEVRKMRAGWTSNFRTSKNLICYIGVIFKRRQDAIASARPWAEETGWPLVIDGKVVEPK